MGTRNATDDPAVATRMADIKPFHVMALLARARELEAQGRTIVHMEIGEPDFVTPAPVIAAGIRALSSGLTRYTPAAGLPELRQAIATYYRTRYGVELSPRRVVITPGASGALQLILGTLINPGDEVLMTDPGYPCNRHFVRLFEGRAIGVPVDEATQFCLTPELVADHCSERTRAVLLASPANPTGGVMSGDDLARMAGFCRERGIHLVVDEIYHGLVYAGDAMTALAASQDTFIVNSFSKYFGMTGWRLGWLVAPESYVPYIDRLAQNIFLAAPTLAQHAALTAFSAENLSILEARRDEFRERRDYLVPALRDLGFLVPYTPQGAFYVYAGCGRFTDDSHAFAYRLLEEAGVAITPGRDFGRHKAAAHVRFAYTTSLANLAEGVRRIGNFV